MFRNWWQRVTRRSPKSTRKSQRSRRRGILGFETLENRWVLSAWTPAPLNVGPDLGKIYNEYESFVHQTDNSFSSPGFISPENGQYSIVGDKVLVEVRGQGDMNTLLSTLNTYQFQVRATASNLVDGYIPLGNLLSIASSSSVVAVTPSMVADATNSVGSVSNAADGTLKGDISRRLFGVDGTGITIGVISDSANQVGGGLSDSIASGNLGPLNVSTFLDIDGPAGSTDEGRAMMELIHDIAPGAKLRFASGLGGEASFATAVNDLVAHGCQIIVDDLNGLADEEFFQDGVASQAVTAAVASGVTYFSSAGNQGQSGYDSPFLGVNATVGGVTGRWHNFNSGPGAPDPLQTILLQPGTTFFIFQYDQVWGSVTKNATMYVLDATGTNVITSGTAVNTSTQMAQQIIAVTNFSGVAQPATIAIQSVSGGDPGRFHYIAQNGPVITDHLVETGAFISTIDPGHGANLNAISVAAADAATPTIPEFFTSQGPVSRVFGPTGNVLPTLQLRNKPDITSNDGVDASVPGFSPFYGTSAAAPDAAAIAALLLQFQPGLTPAQVKAAMIAGTVDINTPGYDLTTGFGLIDGIGGLIGLDGGLLTIKGDFDAANENDNIVLINDAVDPTQVDVTINGALIGSVRKTFIKNLTVDGLGGNDTLTLDFSRGNFLPATGVTFDGGTGSNTIQIVGDANMTLANASLTLSGGISTSVVLTNVQVANLTGGASSNTFDVSGWTGTGAIVGGGGADTVSATGNGTFTFGATALIVSAGANMSLSGIANLNLTGGAGNDTFTDSGWTGTATLAGGGGATNTLAANANANFILSNTSLAAGTATLGFSNIQNFALAGGASANTFNVGAYSLLFPVSLNGVSGADSVVASADANFTLTNTTLTVARGANKSIFGLTNIPTANLTALAASTFTINSWGGKGSLTAGTGIANFIFGGGNLNGLTGAWTAGGGSANNTLTVNDTAYPSNAAYDLSPSTIVADIITPRPFGGITYGATVKSVTVNGSLGVDKFIVTPSLVTSFTVNGSGPVSKGNFLGVNFLGTTGKNLNPVYNSVTGSGKWNFTSGQQPISFTNIQQLNGTGIFITTGSTDYSPQGQPLVNVYDAETGTLKFQIMAYESTFRGGVQVAIADMNDDGIDDIITAPGKGRSADIKVFNGMTGAQIGQTFTAYPNFTQGVNIAAGDLLGNGHNEIIVAPARTSANVKVFSFNGTTGTLMSQFAAYPSTFIGGVVVAAGNVLGLGKDEIVTAPQAGMASIVEIFDSAGNKLKQFQSFPTSFTNGVSLATGDVNGDGIDDILVGAGPGGSSMVHVHSGLTGALLWQFQAFTDSSDYAAVHVATKPILGNGRMQIIVAQGQNGKNAGARVFQFLNPTPLATVPITGKVAINGLNIG